jgi:hypothetical protein
LGFAAREVGEYAAHWGSGMWADQSLEGGLNQSGESAKELEEKGSEREWQRDCHRLKSCQRLAASVTRRFRFQKFSTDEVASHHRVLAITGIAYKPRVIEVC